jgi:[protein-PII] uridylyltransferase
MAMPTAVTHSTKLASTTNTRDARHARQVKLDRPQVVASVDEAPAAYARAWRVSVSKARDALKQQYLSKPDPSRHLRTLSALTDALLQQLANDIALPPEYALVAVGGYGRGLLYPASDVDILILLPDGITPTQIVERFVTLLWDVGLEPGISVRTVTECIEEARKDVTVDTSLLEARAIWGDVGLVNTLANELITARNLNDFFDAKIEEQRIRHARHNDVALNLEPNIKESPGGLRDLQMVLWLSKAANVGGDWSELAAAGIITKDEAKHIIRHARTLGDLRIRLHYLSNRREDRLVFDYQTTLANDLKLAGSKNESPSEALMHRYYLTAKAIWQMNSILLTNLMAHISTRREDVVVTIDDEFSLVNGNIVARDVQIFQRDPHSIFRAFLALQRVREAEFFAPETLRALWRAVPLIDRAFREDAETSRLFLQILKSEKVTFTLRRMSRYGVLGRYIPAFGRIVGQMQHDLFHVYSVDEHILMVIRNLRRLVLPRFAHEFPFCHDLAREFERPEILYLAALFHDIAKGRGGDHSELGKKDARAFCKKLGISKADGELVVWLVETHLQMSSTAQKQDLSDPEVIAHFASRILNERWLVALYLLTVADIRGTSPHVWNNWKAKLLEDLFRATRRLLRGDAVPNEHWIEVRRSAALQAYQTTTKSTREPALWSHVDTSYFQRFDPTEMAWHAEALDANAAPPQALVRAYAAEGADFDAGFAIMVMTRDQPGLFARITSYFEQLSFDIAAAKVFTTQHGYALDMFQVLPKRGKATSYRDIGAAIERELAVVLDAQKPIPSAASGNAARASRQVRHLPITPVITLTPSRRKPFYELSISCADRPGLLSTIARELLRFDVNLYDARISTLGQRAEDVFVVDCAALSDVAFASTFAEKLTDEIRSA